MKPARLIFTIFATALLVVVTANAGEKGDRGTVAGCLIDSQTGLAVADAWVVISETGQGSKTDSSGCFAINDVLFGTYHLAVTHSLYGTIEGLPELVVTVGAGQNGKVTVSLRSKVKGSTSTTDKPGGVLDKVADWLGFAEKSAPFQSTTPERPGGSYAPGIVRVPTQENRSGDYGHVEDRSKCAPDPQFYPDYNDLLPPTDMFFEDYGTNGFVDTKRDRFSTFALDVDDASYNLARRYLLDGLMPPTDAVRVEEFINHFEYGYNVPNDETFRVFTEITNSPFEPDKQIMKVAVKGGEIERYERKPMNITFVIDVSGSMGRDNRFNLVRESIETLVRQLDGRDRVGMVAYGSRAFEVLVPISAARQREIFAALDRLAPNGTTYAEAGIRLGYEMANRQFFNGHNNVIILCSDGVANVGRTSPDEIMSEVRQFAGRGITMSTFGYGMGNYNDVLLEQLAIKGNGRYAYINGTDDIRTAFVDKFTGTMQVLARDVKVQVEFNPKAVRAYRLLGYENRAVADSRFRDNRQDGGEVGAGDEVTAVYEVALNHGRTGEPVATVHVRWKNAEGTAVFELARDVDGTKHYAEFDEARPELRLAVVAARFAEMLKGTRYAAGTSYEALIRLAEPLRHELPGEQIEDLCDMIRRAGNLSDWHAEHDDDDYSYGDYNYKR